MNSRDNETSSSQSEKSSSTQSQQGSTSEFIKTVAAGVLAGAILGDVSW